MVSEVKKMTEALKCWLVEFKEWRASFGWTQKQFRNCPYCGDSRPLDALGVKLSDKFCPACGHEMKEVNNG